MTPEIAAKLTKRLVQRWIVLLEGELSASGFWEQVEAEVCAGTRRGAQELTAADKKAATDLLRAAQAWLLLGGAFITSMRGKTR